MTNPAHLEALCGLIPSTARDAFPGDTARISIGKFMDVSRVWWPAGTLFYPLSAGYNNLARADQQIITVGDGQGNVIVRRDRTTNNFIGRG